MSNDFSQEVEEIIRYIHQNGLHVFYASNLLDNPILPEITWNNNVNYGDFFALARTRGVDAIIFDVDLLTDKILEEIDRILKSNQGISNIEELKYTPGITKRINSYVFAYIKDGIMYCLRDQAKWSDDLHAQLSKLEVVEDEYEESHEEGELKKLEKRSIEDIGDELLQIILGRSPNAIVQDIYPIENGFWNEKGINEFHGRGAEIREKVNQYVTKRIEDMERERLERPVEDIGQEFLQILLTNFPNATIEDIRTIEYTFWVERGINLRHSKAEVLKEKVRQYVIKKIEDREKERLPALIEDCVAWARENGMKKMTKTNVDVFMNERDITLSRSIKDMLYHNINVKLKSINLD